MKPNLASALFLTAALSALSGCERETPTGASPQKKAGNQESAAPKPGTNSVGDMILVSGGRFVMGDKTEVDATPHEVVVRSFYMDKYLVTQEQYQKVMGANPSRWKGGKNPVEQVRWSEAAKFCNQRSQLEGLEACYDLRTGKCNFAANGYRLPTEAEWEYACRAGTSTAYFFGDTPARLGEYAWFEENAGSRPRPVGQKLANAWGLYDMNGNVWEWCNDFYKVDYYQEAPQQDPKGPDSSQTKVVRGGAWRFNAETCRSGYRYNEKPGSADACFGYDIYGFRCVRALAGNPAP
ncbi:Serine/threonine kinase [Verrucomicrobia bacterium]|nr:Serine/threonine kinase [Verrucomicrobiota bacterium]